LTVERFFEQRDHIGSHRRRLPAADPAEGSATELVTVAGGSGKG